MRAGTPPLPASTSPTRATRSAGPGARTPPRRGGDEPHRGGGRGPCHGAVSQPFVEEKARAVDGGHDVVHRLPRLKRTDHLNQRAFVIVRLEGAEAAIVCREGSANCQGEREQHQQYSRTLAAHCAARVIRPPRSISARFQNESHCASSVKTESYGFRASTNSTSGVRVAFTSAAANCAVMTSPASFNPM